MIREQKNTGFTLVEMIIVIALIGIISAIAIPQYLGYLENSKRQSAISVLEQFPLLLETYRADYGVMCPDCNATGTHTYEDNDEILAAYPNFKAKASSTGNVTDAPYSYYLKVIVAADGTETATFNATPVDSNYPGDIPSGSYK
jgi:prepilin-type N-terminal cleavage/methylation domain-containing protein